MLIKDLPEELRELVKERHKLYYNSAYSGLTIDSKEANVNNMLNWNNTPEGVMFWGEVDQGKDVKHYLCYPRKKELFYQIF